MAESRTSVAEEEVGGALADLCKAIWDVCDADSDGTASALRAFESTIRSLGDAIADARRSGITVPRIAAAGKVWRGFEALLLRLDLEDRVSTVREIQADPALLTILYRTEKTFRLSDAEVVAPPVSWRRDGNRVCVEQGDDRRVWVDGVLAEVFEIIASASPRSLSWRDVTRAHNERAEGAAQRRPDGSIRYPRGTAPWGSTRTAERKGRDVRRRLREAQLDGFWHQDSHGVAWCPPH